MQELRVSDPPAARAELPAAPGVAGAAQEADSRGGEAAGLRSGLGPGLPADPGADAAAAPASQRSRPAAEYALEPELARECAAAEAAEAGEQRAKPQLHLVVLGHVDAGKSTLMGRLLHDLGCAVCA